MGLDLGTVNPSQEPQHESSRTGQSEVDPVQRREEPQQSRRAPFPIVGVGASAGGLEAFTQLLRALPSRTGMAYVLVQHLDLTHESALTELLARATEMPVRQVTDAMPVDPNRVYVIPPNVDMVISQGILRLTPRTETCGHHMPIDRFLRSLAEDKGSNAIGVILSGTASDGTLGLARAALVFRVFFNSGQRFCFHRRIFSRSSSSTKAD